MYRNEVFTTSSHANSFTVCLPGHNYEFPRDNQCSQADYMLSFKPKLDLDPTAWTCSLRSLIYSNSYSTYIPETPMKRMFMMVDVEYNKMVAKGQSLLMHTPHVRVHTIYHGYVIWVNETHEQKGDVKFKRGLYYHMDEILFELNRIYKSLNVKAHFRKSGENINLTLTRENDTQPWIVPYFESDLANRIGLPNINSPEMQPILTQLANTVGNEATLVFTSDSVVRDGRRNIGLYIDFLYPNFDGLRSNEVIRLPGRLSGRFFDTNIINFHDPVSIPLRSGDIKLVRVQFKDENGDVVNFPIGQNMVILEFNKRNKV